MLMNIKTSKCQGNGTKDYGDMSGKKWKELWLFSRPCSVARLEQFDNSGNVVKMINEQTIISSMAPSFYMKMKIIECLKVKVYLLPNNMN